MHLSDPIRKYLMTASPTLRGLRYLLALQLAFFCVLALRAAFFHATALIYGNPPDLTIFTPWIAGVVGDGEGTEMKILVVGFVGLTICTWFISRMKPVMGMEALSSWRFLLIANILTLSSIAGLTIAQAPASLAFSKSAGIEFSWLALILFIGFAVLPVAKRWKIQFLTYLVIVTCTLISEYPFHLYNYSYVLEPAVKAISAQPLSTIVAQYDLLLSLTALPFVIAKVDLNLYKVFLQLANTGFVLWMFYELHKIVRKEIVLLCAFSYVLAKYYLNISDPYTTPQILFLRLELWFPLYVLVRHHGLVSKWVLGYLVSILLLSHTFGLLVSLAYLTFLAALCASQRTPDQFKEAGIAGAVIIPAIALTNFLVSNQRLDDYMKHQISFMKIGQDSGFWLLASVFIFCAVVVFERNKVSNKNLANSLLFFLFSFQAAYFFGRSHENNILNISTPLIFCVAIAINTLWSQTKLVKPAALLAAAFLSTAVASEWADKARSFYYHGLSPRFEMARGDFSAISSTPEYASLFDGKTIICFPYSALDFYLFYYRIGNYGKLDQSTFRSCNSILFLQDFQDYSDQLHRAGFTLQVLNTREF
jgi:hypothetical protein